MPRYPVLEELEIRFKVNIIKYSYIRPTTSSLVTLGGSLQCVSIMLIGLWLITSRELYLEEVATRSCDMYKIEGSAKLTVHTRGYCK